MSKHWFTPEFDGFAPPAKPLPKTDNGVVSWQRWKSKHYTACDQCVLDAASGARTSAPMQASYVRTDKRQKVQRLYLCYGHAREKRDSEHR